MITQQAKPKSGRDGGGVAIPAIATGVLCGVLGGVAFGLLYLELSSLPDPETGRVEELQGVNLPFAVAVAAFIGLVVSTPSTVVGAVFLRRARVGAVWWQLTLATLAASVGTALIEVPPLLAILSVAGVYVAGCFAATRWAPAPGEGACEGCGYDLHGIEAGVCPECGKERQHDA